MQENREKNIKNRVSKRRNRGRFLFERKNRVKKCKNRAIVYLTRK